MDSLFRFVFDVALGSVDRVLGFEAGGAIFEKPSDLLFFGMFLRVLRLIDW